MGKCNLKFKPRSNTWSNSNATCRIDNAKGIYSAWSYKWWQMLRYVPEYNLYLVNTNKYSPTTQTHLAALKRWISSENLNKKYEILNVDAPNGLQALDIEDIQVLQVRKMLELPRVLCD
jgi:hypothetical protein